MTASSKTSKELGIANLFKYLSKFSENLRYAENSKNHQNDILKSVCLAWYWDYGKMIADTKIERMITFGTPAGFSITIETHRNSHEHEFHQSNNVRFPIMIGDHDFCSQ
jgi:hypothetical protein